MACTSSVGSRSSKRDAVRVGARAHVEHAHVRLHPDRRREATPDAVAQTERRYVVGAVVIRSDIGENLVELFAPDRGETRLTGQFTRSERGRGHRGFISLVGMILDARPNRALTRIKIPWTVPT